MEVNRCFDYRESARNLTPAYKKMMMTHEYCRSLYLVMLMDLPLEWVGEFWSQHPLTMPEGTLSGTDLLRFLWKNGRQVPVFWDCEIANAVEPFFVAKDKLDINFTQRMLYRNNSGTYVPGKKILNWFYPLMSTAFNVVDARDMVFKLITVFAEKVWRGHLHRRIKRVEEKGWVNSFLAYIPDRTYQNLVEFNFDYLAGEQTKSSPKILGLEPFEEIDYYADIRPVHRVLWTGEVEIRGSLIFIDGEEYGRKATFYEFLRAHDLDVSEYNAPDAEIFLISKDYRCPLRKRTVVYSGCAYGAPLYIMRVRHEKKRIKEKNLLGPLVADTAVEDDFSETELEKKHLELLARLEAKADFTYHVADQAISLNGKHFLKNVPAKILKHIVLAYSRDGKREFEYRDFKREFEISFGQKNSNFEIRLLRLMDKLEKENTGLKIERTERGSFTLHAKAKVSFQEKP